jgi:hypothetical protein
MAQSKPAHRSILSRSLAALILVGIYAFSIIGVSTLMLGASSTAAFARGDGRGGGGRGGGRGVGRGGGRGWVGGRGRGYGRGYGYGGGVYVTPGCYWVAGVRVCPY